MSGLALNAGDVHFETVPSVLRPIVRAYAARLADVPRDRLHLALWEGMYTLPPSERRFATAEAIRATAFVGDRDELRARIEALAAVGVTQIAAFGCFDNFHAVATEVSRNLIA